jgi:hypothetical protein
VGINTLETKVTMLSTLLLNIKVGSVYYVPEISQAPVEGVSGHRIFPWIVCDAY